MAARGERTISLRAGAAFVEPVGENTSRVCQSSGAFVELLLEVVFRRHRCLRVINPYSQSEGQVWFECGILL